MTSSTTDATRPLRRRRRRALWIGLTVLVLALAAVGVARAMTARATKAVPAADVTVLAYDTFVDSISATGTVAAAKTTKVYSTLAFPVQEVFVEVGDVVAPGDKLAQLDPATIDKQISAKSALMNQSAVTSATQVVSAQHRYEASRAAIDNGTNAAIVQASSAVSNAYAAWQKASKAYEDYKASLAGSTNAQLIQAKSTLDSARANLASAQYAATQAQTALTAATTAYAASCTANPGAAGCADLLAAKNTAQQAYDKAALALAAATTAERNAQAAYDAVAVTADNTLADLKAGAATAYEAYTNAQAALKAAQTGAKTELQLSLDALRTAQAGASTDASVQDLASLQKDKASTTITAPTAGMVTAVYANVGGPGTGLLFVIETTDRLSIDATVKEYDVNTVKVGMPVQITSDPTRDAVYEGRLSTIAPTSLKDQAGNTITGNDVQYKTTIEVVSAGTGLRIGMNVRLEYVLGRQENVLAVPSDAVYSNAQGQLVILAAVPQSGDQYALREIPVTVGLENDLNIIVSGPEVAEGLRVINTPSKYTVGSTVTIA